MKQGLSILIFLTFCSAASGQKLNFDAVDRYFSITDSLRQDIPLSVETWNELLAYPGIKLYLENQNLEKSSLDAYRKNLEFVYMPKYDSILQVRVKDREKYFTAYVINQYKTSEQAFKSYLKHVKAHQSAYLDSIYANCYTMLPKKMQQKALQTTLYFTPLWNDAVAEGNDIVFTLYCAYHFDQLKYGALGGHEMHHILRKNKTIADPKDQYLYQALSNLLNEGSADLIDKKLTSNPNCPDDLAFYDYLVEVGKSIMPNLDSAIINHANKIKQLEKDDIPAIVGMSGHLPGCYMASIIEKNGLRNEVVKNVDDPIRFMMTYQKAALKDAEKPFVFSKTTMDYLKRIKPR
jgi:hypothetical protein